MAWDRLPFRHPRRDGDPGEGMMVNMPTTKGNRMRLTMDQESTQTTPFPEHGGEETAEQKTAHAEAADDVGISTTEARRPPWAKWGCRCRTKAALSSMAPARRASKCGDVVHSRSLPLRCKRVRFLWWIGRPTADPNEPGFHLDFRRLWLVRKSIHPHGSHAIDQELSRRQWIVAFNFPMGIPFGGYLQDWRTSARFLRAFEMSQQPEQPMGTCSSFKPPAHRDFGPLGPAPSFFQKRTRSGGLGVASGGSPRRAVGLEVARRGECWFPDVDGDRPSRTLASTRPGVLFRVAL